jgi:hypothetical protein
LCPCRNIKSFVELGEYLCEVRAKKYWRLEKLKSFDEFLEKRFADSRRKAYYLMAIHENLTRIPKHELQQVGSSKATELAKVARKDGEGFDCATWLHKAKESPKEGFKCAVEPRSFRRRDVRLARVLYKQLTAPGAQSLVPETCLEFPISGKFDRGSGSAS